MIVYFIFVQEKRPFMSLQLYSCGRLNKQMNTRIRFLGNDVQKV